MGRPAELEITIRTTSNMGEQQHQERAELGGLLDEVKAGIGTGTALGGSIRNRSGQHVGSWIYRPGADA
jgi:hypothetical protein